MDAILQLISGRSFEIAESWGLTQLSNILIQRHLGADSDYYERKRQESLRIFTYEDGIYSGVYSKDYKDRKKKGSGTKKKSNVAVISMEGIMMTEGGMCQKGINDIVREFEMIYQDDYFDGIVFNVNSGGGESTAGDLIYNTILDRNKPVVVYTPFLGSAAVKGTLPADEIIAASTSSEIGSIGTMLSISKERLAKAKEDDLDIYSKHSPDKNGGFRALKNDDLEPLIERVTRIDEQFMKKVRSHRTLNANVEGGIKKTLAGGMFITADAKDRGLIDKVGTMKTAIGRISSHIKYFK